MLRTAEDHANVIGNAVPRTQSLWPNVLGWVGLGLITLAACFWAFWGAIEAFHEGWCQPTLASRLLQTSFYLVPAVGLCVLAAISIVTPKVGSIFCLATSVLLASWVVLTGANFGAFILLTLIGIPFLLGLLFWFGQALPKRIALTMALGIPGLVAFACGVEPAWRVTHRFDDGIREARLVVGNGTELTWAPAGPGWARYGNVTWEEALDQVSRLSADGQRLADEPQHIWRLPTRSEIVTSLTRDNQNSGGTWDVDTQTAKYHVKPDKESPIWDSLAPLIYLWTSEAATEGRAWIVVYHGGVYSKPKSLGAASLGFRAVK